MEKLPADDVMVLTHAFHVPSPCGRVFEVGLDTVRDDYVDFMVEADGISKEDALSMASVSDLKSWFLEQFSWSDVDRLGHCIQQPTPDQILKALDRMRGGSHPSDNCALKEDPKRVASLQAKGLEARLSESPHPNGAAGPRI